MFDTCFALDKNFRFDLEAAHKVPGFDTELQTNHTPETDEYGIRSMFYSANRPFHPQRLFDAVYTGGSYDSMSSIGPKSFLNKILRSKGFFYFAHNMEMCLEWSTAGRSCNFSAIGPWACTRIPKKDWPLDDSNWTQDFGDRRQRLVIIGEHLNESDVTSVLDACLLTDEEIKAGEDAWKKYADDELWGIEEENEHGEDEDNESSDDSMEEESSEENDD